MALDQALVTSEPSQLEACALYRALMGTAAVGSPVDSGEEPSLGGKLLYAGELNAARRTMVIAANVAGCATLAVTADLGEQKLSVREGVVDFLVTSLDEALRILKNEIRMHKTVAVCVGVSQETIEGEMLERGVQPDLVFAGVPGKRRAVRDFLEGSREIQFAEADSGLAALSWGVAEAPARWMPKLDAIALTCVTPHSLEHRWIRRSPRYCGRSALARRSLLCDPQIAREIIGRVTDSVRGGEIGVEVSVSFDGGDEHKTFRILPEKEIS